MDKEKTFLYVIITLIILLLCTTVSTGFYKNRYDKLVSEYRTKCELARTRAEQYENIYRSARDTNRELGECLSRSTTTLSGLREQLREIRKRYEEMENLFNSVRDNDCDVGNNDNSIDSDSSK